MRDILFSAVILLGFFSCAGGNTLKTDSFLNKASGPSLNVTAEETAKKYGKEEANKELAVLAEEGSAKTAYAAWWGFNAADSTEALQKAFDSKAETIIIGPAQGKWISRPLFLGSGKKIVFLPGTVLEAKRGEFLGRGDSLITVSDAENVVLSGYGAGLKMHKKDYQKKPYEKAEWRMAVSVRSSKNVVIEGLAIRESGGDGIYLGTGKALFSENIIIRDCIIEDNHRQGISVISVKGLLIENCIIRGTSGTPPQAGIDFEPNRTTHFLQDIIVRNCLIEKNRGAGVLVSCQNLKENPADISIVVENSVLRKNFWQVWIQAIGGLSGGEIIFRNNQIKGQKFILDNRAVNIVFE
jgi:hypothetical protein